MKGHAIGAKLRGPHHRSRVGTGLTLGVPCLAETWDKLPCRPRTAHISARTEPKNERRRKAPPGRSRGLQSPEQVVAAGDHLTAVGHSGPPQRAVFTRWGEGAQAKPKRHFT